MATPPYIFESNFEQGSNAEWDSESDTGSLLDFPHYSLLSNISTAPVPYRGAYCMRIQMGDTNDHTLIEGDIDIADAGTAYTRFYLFASSDVTASADDTFNIYELQQAAGTNEMVLGMRITAATNLLEIGIGDAAAPTSFVTFPRNRWVNVELLATPSTGGAGVLTLFLDELQVATLTSLTQAAAIGRGVLGTQDTLSTTTGTLYFDQFIFDDLRIYGIPIRYPEELYMTKTGHAFVGAGKVINASLLSGGGTDNVLQIFDTDVNNTNHMGRMKLELKNVANNDIVDPAGVPLTVQRGCYVVLTGTGPARAMIQIGSAQGYYSQGRIKQHGAKRIPTPGNW
jgi:hypothetical protein